MTLSERLFAELMRYGIYPSSPDVDSLTAEDLEVLLRHIYGNRDLVYRTKDLTIDVLKGQVEDAHIIWHRHQCCPRHHHHTDPHKGCVLR